MSEVIEESQDEEFQEEEHLCITLDLIEAVYLMHFLF